jgi:protein SCO1/2
MNRINKPSAARSVAMALALMLAGCSDTRQEQQDPPLAGAAIGGDFTLTDSKGETVRWGDFAGRYRIVYFGYTFCPDVCPTDMQRTAQGLKALKAKDPAKAGKIATLFITVDPERDTQAVVGEFAAAFSPDIIGLTGTPAQIEAAAKAFKIFYAKGEAQPGGGYLVDHSNVVYLFGPDGAPIATLPADRGGDAVAAELVRWVN